jgi:hypothetical protein
LAPLSVEHPPSATRSGGFPAPSVMHSSLFRRHPNCRGHSCDLGALPSRR